MKRSEVGSWAMKTGSLKEICGKARVRRYFGGGSGEPISREVVNGTRFSIPKAGPVSECAGQSMTATAMKAAITVTHNRLHRSVIIVLLSHSGATGVQAACGDSATPRAEAKI